MNRLERDGRSVKLEPRAMEVLVYLASRAGEVVSADELIDAVWEGRVVGDGAIYQSINQLRQALADSTQDVAFIETIPKRGYRLTAAVSPLDSTASEESVTTDDSHRPKWKTGLAGAGVLALVLALIVSYLPDEKQPDVLPNSIAVLPFANLSPDPDNAYFAAGMHEEILNQLVKLKSLNVISRTSVLQYADNRPPIPQIASELNVQAILEGSVRFDGETVLVQAQLIDAATDSHLWSGRYERALAGVFAIQADIAMNIANALDAEFSSDEPLRIAAIPTDSEEAYALYLQSFKHQDGQRKSSIELLDQAIELDPDFALAHAKKAWLYTYSLFGFGFLGSTPAEAVEAEAIVRESAERALSLDPRIGLAHAALAAVHAVHWRGEMAEAAFQRAYELTPDAFVALNYGRFKRYRGDYAGAIELLERAVALNPNVGETHGQLGLAYLFNKNYEAAAGSFRVLDDSNVGGKIGLAYSEIGLGNDDEAVRQLELVEKLELSTVRLAQVALAYALAGRREDAERVFAAFEESANSRPVGDAVWAEAYLAIGDYQRALERLESAVMERVFTDLPTLSRFAFNTWNIPQLDEPEFRELLDGLWDQGMASRFTELPRS